MDKTDKHENIFERAALACGAATAAYSVVALCFVAVFCAAKVHIAVVACLVIACVIPFAVMPVTYSAVHRISLLLFGRYHLAMPLSAFVAALSFVFMFSSASNQTAQDCAVFFGATVCASALAVYRYCSFSVRVRSRSGCGVTLSYSIAAVLGAVAAIACLAGFYAYDPQTVFQNTAYIIAAACVVCAIVQYLATFYSVPQFSGSSAMTVRRAASAVYGGLNKRVFAASILSAAAGFIPIGLAAYFCLTAGLSAYAAIGCTAATVAAYIGCAAALKISRGAKTSAAVMFAAYILSAILFSVCATVAMSATGATCAVVFASASSGAGLAACNRAKQERLPSAKPDGTIGTAFILSGLAANGGAAVAVAVISVVIGLVRYGAVAPKLAFAAAFAFAAVVAATAFALCIAHARGAEAAEGERAAA